MKTVSVWASGLFSLFFPNVCHGCGRDLTTGEEVLCIHCWFHLPRTGFHGDPGNPVAVTFWGRVRVDSATAFLFYSKEGTTRNLLHQLKYKGKGRIGEWLGEEFGRELINFCPYKSADAIVPVPLHPKKQRIRGYNQSEKIALGMGTAMEKEVSTDLLLRKSFSRTQTRKSRYARWENVKDIFHLVGEERFVGKHIILVDDVITTGATLEACAELISKIPDVKISLAAVAFTRR